MINRQRAGNTLPLGNGRLGMMPDGCITSEKIVLNEISLWSGNPQHPNNYEAYKSVNEIQRLLLQGQNDDAERLVNASFVCAGAGSGQGAGAEMPYRCFQTLSELQIRYDHKPADLTNSCRQLDLSTTIASTSYELDGVTYHREYFTSFSGDIGIVRLPASRGDMVGFTATLSREESATLETVGRELRMFGALNDGRGGLEMKHIARVQIRHPGGRLITDGNSLKLVGADYNPYAQQSAEVLKQALQKPYDQFKETHTTTFQRLFTGFHLR